MSKNFVEVAPDLFLHSSQEDRGDGRRCVTYELENAHSQEVHFVLDCTGSENFEVLGKEDSNLVMEGNCAPYQRMLLGKLVVVDQYQRASIKTATDYVFKEPDLAKLNGLIEQDRRAIRVLQDVAQRLGFDQDSKTTPEIEQICAAHNTLFLDLDFPPTEASLFGSEASNHAGDLVTWRRPRDFMRGKYAVFEEGIEPGDIRQGQLTNCWFLCVLASLAEFPSLVERLFESSQVSEAGAYRVRFCVNGQWVWTLLDDYFPCYPGAGPIYSTSHGNELWVLLLEKAYAKFYGSYNALRYGVAFEAMVDLTGCPWQVVELHPDFSHGQTETKGAPPTSKEAVTFDPSQLWVNLLRWDAAGYLMSAQTPGEDVASEDQRYAVEADDTNMGLIPGHAYTLLVAQQLSTGEKMVKLRNPWGRYEWTGAWSDDAPEWTEEARLELGVEDFADDGTFWMSIEDLCQYFINISICQVRLQDQGAWFEQRRKVCFSFNRQTGVNVPMYILHNDESTNLAYFSIHQEDQRCPNAQDYMDMGITILGIQPDFSYSLVGSSGITCDRQNQTEVVLNPGQYLIVPASTGCKFAQESTVTASQMVLPGLFEGEEPGGDFSPEVTSALKEIFFRLDMDLDGLLNFEELNNFMELTEGYSMPPDVHSWLVTNFDCKDGALTQDGFIQIYKYLWQSGGRDPNIIWRDLEYMGYDRSLRLIAARSAMVVVHAEKKFKLYAQAFDPDAYEEAMELPVKKWGSCEKKEGGKINIYVYRAGTTGVTIAIENNHESQALKITVDCSQGATNVISHRGSLVAMQEVPPRETKILHQLMPQNTFEKWTWQYNVTEILWI